MKDVILAIGVPVAPNPGTEKSVEQEVSYMHHCCKGKGTNSGG